MVFLLWCEQKQTSKDDPLPSKPVASDLPNVSEERLRELTILYVCTILTPAEFDQLLYKKVCSMTDKTGVLAWLKTAGHVDEKTRKVE